MHMCRSIYINFKFARDTRASVVRAHRNASSALSVRVTTRSHAQQSLEPTYGTVETYLTTRKPRDRRMSYRDTLSVSEAIQYLVGRSIDRFVVEKRKNGHFPSLPETVQDSRNGEKFCIFSFIRELLRLKR